MDAQAAQVRVLPRRPLTKKEFNRLREIDQKIPYIKQDIECFTELVKKFNGTTVHRRYKQQLDKAWKTFQKLDSERKALRLKRKGYEVK